MDSGIGGVVVGIAGVLGIFGMFGLVVVVILAALKAQEKRTLELATLAERHGFEFYKDGMSMPQSVFTFGKQSTCPHEPEFVPFFELYQLGSSRTIRPAIIGLDGNGTKWYLLDYRYTVSSGKNSHTYQYSVVVARVGMQFPKMSLTLQHFLHSVGKMLGAREVEVESEEFNKRYYVKTSDPKLALDLLHPQMIEYLLSQEPLEWHFSGPYVMIAVLGKATVQDFEQRMRYVQDFLDRIPDYYKQDNPA